jgi:hypothetical protein
LLSGDGEFTSVGLGNQSFINYRENFDRYKQIIITAHKTKWYSDLMLEWGSVIFPHGVEGVEVNVEEPEPTSFMARRAARDDEFANVLQQMQISGHLATQEDLDNNTPRPSDDEDDDTLSYLSDAENESQTPQRVSSDLDDQRNFTSAFQPHPRPLSRTYALNPIVIPSNPMANITPNPVTPDLAVGPNRVAIPNPATTSLPLATPLVSPIPDSLEVQVTASHKPPPAKKGRNSKKATKKGDSSSTVTVEPSQRPLRSTRSVSRSVAPSSSQG